MKGQVVVLGIFYELKEIYVYNIFIHGEREREDMKYPQAIYALVM
jgi:hypothetical protein